MLLYHHGIAVIIHRNLWIGSISTIVRFDELGRSPAKSWNAAVGPDAVACSVKLLPYRHSVSAAIDCYLRVKRIPIVRLDEFQKWPPNFGQPDKCLRLSRPPVVSYTKV